MDGQELPGETSPQAQDTIFQQPAPPAPPSGQIPTTGIPNGSEIKHKQHYTYLLAVLIILVAIGAIYLTLHLTTTQYPVVVQQTTSIRPSAYEINFSSLPNASAENYLQPEVLIGKNYSFHPDNIVGFINGYSTSIVNSTKITTPNVPITAFSQVSVFNNTASAMQQYNYNYNISMRQQTAGGLNLTVLNVPQIGDATAGFAIWPESNNTKVFIVIFRYKTIVARVGVFETINSTSPSAAIYLAQQLQAKMRSQ